jgi:hypothetical protein
MKYVIAPNLTVFCVLALIKLHFLFRFFPHISLVPFLFLKKYLFGFCLFNATYLLLNDYAGHVCFLWHRSRIPHYSLITNLHSPLSMLPESTTLLSPLECRYFCTRKCCIKSCLKILSNSDLSFLIIEPPLHCDFFSFIS